MRVSVRITPRDLLLASGLYLVRSTPFIYLVSCLVGISFLLHIYFEAVSWSLTGISFALAYSVLMVGLFMLTGITGLVFARQLPAIRSKKGLGEQHFSLSQGGVEVTSDTGVLTVRWEQVRHLRRLGRYWVLQIRRNDYLIVPLRSFESEQQQLQFIDSINAYRLQSRQSKPVDIYQLVPGLDGKLTSRGEPQKLKAGLTETE